MRRFFLDRLRVNDRGRFFRPGGVDQQDDIKYLMWEYREDISLDVDESAGLAPINGGFIDGWVLVTSPAHNATSRIFRLRYEEIVSYLRKHDEGYF